METADFDILTGILSHFPEVGKVVRVEPLTSGLINRTYRVVTANPQVGDYILQRVNHAVFTDVPLLQHNIEAVTDHLHRKMHAMGVGDIDRRVLRFVKADDGTTFHFTGEGYWRVCAYIKDSVTKDVVTPETSYLVGRKFGEFESMLSDMSESIGETIPDFHNMELRCRQLQEAVEADKAGRLAQVKPIVDDIMADSYEMCRAERLYREGKLPKRICHCDTKVSNMLFDEHDNVLCIIDLDTTMPSFVFSDFGDFLRSAANTAAEDEPDLEKIHFNEEIFKAFAKGYIESTSAFLTPIERSMLPYSVALFPYMQAVRFLADYLNGDTYYRIAYPEHNLVRTKAQYHLYREVMKAMPMIESYLESI